MSFRGARALVPGCVLGLGAAAIAGVVLSFTSGLGFHSGASANAPWPTGVLEVEQRTCTLGKVITPHGAFRIYGSPSGGVAAAAVPARKEPAFWDLPAGAYKVVYLGQARAVRVAANQLTREVFGYTGPEPCGGP